MTKSIDLAKSQYNIVHQNPNAQLLQQIQESLESLVLFSRFGDQLFGVALVGVVGRVGDGEHVVVLRWERF